MNEEYIKDFDTWNEQTKLLNAISEEMSFRTREVWWCALGVNIGSEQDGKNEKFERPVVIVRRISKDLFIGVPLTSKISIQKDRITANIFGQQSQILLAHVKSISSKRLLRKIGILKITIFQRILIRLADSILCQDQYETPP